MTLTARPGVPAGVQLNCFTRSQLDSSRMPITQEQFDELVARLERDAGRHPRLYSLKLGAFASLGYLYVFSILVGLMLVSGLLIASLRFGGGLLLLISKLAIPMVILIWVVLRSLWVRIEAPQGLNLKRKDYPELFAMLEGLRRATRAPRLHTVLVIAELNAAVVQVPRLGMFGWQKNFLLLGLPLMQLLSVEEFKAVLAHEFGHLSGAHGRFGAWIYRVRAAWERLAFTLQQEQHWGSFLFVPFFSWFAPQFAAYSFVKARQQEYEADKLAAETISGQHIANALVRLNIKGQDLDEKYWPSVLARANDAPEPNVTPYRGLLADDHRRFLPAAAEQLQQALSRKTSTADTHPCLKDRLKVLGAEATVADTVAESAAAALFGSALDSLVDQFDADWRDGVSGWWQQRHQFVAEAREQLGDLGAQEPDTMSDEDLFTRATLTEEVRSFDDAMPFYQALAARSPDHQGAAFAIARCMLQQDDEDGITRLEMVMAAEKDAVIAGCELIMEYLQRQGREDEITPYSERYWQAQEVAFQAQLLRQNVLTTDRFLPHDLPPESLAKIEQAVQSISQIKLAMLVRKVPPDGDPPLYVLGFEPDLAWRKILTDEDSVTLAERLAAALTVPEEILVIPLNAENKPVARKLRRARAAEIYRA